MMRDFLASATFEFKSSFKKMSTYVYMLLFFAIATLSAYAMGGGLKGAVISFGFSDRMFINSPLTILYVSTLFFALGSSIVAAAFGQSVCKDYLANMDQVIFSKPIQIRSFMAGRFFGTLCSLTVIFSSVLFGVAFATLLPGVQANMVGPSSIMTYIQPYFVSVVPNIFIFGSIYFLLATRTKKMAPVYIAGIIVLMGWLLSGALMSDIENKTAVSLIDGFGFGGVDNTTKYWSVTQKQAGFVWWTDYYLMNRILWMIIGLACLGHAIYHFKPLSQPSKKKKASKELSTSELVTTAEKAHRLPLTTQVFKGFGFSLLSFRAQLRLELRQAFKNIYFICIALASVVHLGIVSTQVGKMYGTLTYPVTYQVLGLIGAMLGLYMLIIITFWCGELVWRDRDSRFHQIIDSTPASTAVLSMSKFVAMNVLVAAFLIVFGLVGLAIQTFKGYYNYELGLYLFNLFVMNYLGFLFLSALALFIQVMTNNKYIGHGVMILFYVYYTFASQLGIEDKLLLPNSAPINLYSDMNGYGHYLYGYFTFKAFWLLIAALMLLVSYLYWPRGTDSQWHGRKKIAKRRLSKPVFASLVTVAVLGTGLAGFIYYNTHVLNQFTTSKQLETDRVAYETQYAKYKDLAQPTTLSIFPKVDIFPYEQELKAQVDYVFENKATEPIELFFANVSSNPNVSFDFEMNPPARLETRDDKLGVHIFRFENPLQPGQKLEVKYNVSVRHPGFNNNGKDSVIVDNGSFIHNYDYFPSVGYSEGNELSSTKTRAKYDLPPKPRMKPITDKKAHGSNYISQNSHWIDFETIVSTSGDQFAIAPGYLIKEWTEGDRRYFHYKMDQKILDFYAYISGKYEVKKDKWNDVAIEVYYHPGHDKNVDSMIQASKDGLEYFSKNFSPYQHRQYRIIEFPRYASYAQAFPNTIPFSEAIGFIAKVDPKDPDDIDYPYYITAHELAHQWWAHQVIGANVQGATVLSESLSQYSALMLMDHKFGREKMKRFLKYELSSYLMGRGSESEKEYSLELNENQQYIHYNKGSLAFYGLKEAVGEDNLNRALKAFVKQYAFKGPPYPVSTDLMRVLKENLQAQHHPIVEELFEQIILFNNRVISTKVSTVKDKHEIAITINAEKLESDAAGNEKKVDFKSPIDIGVRNKAGDFIYLKKHLVQNGESTIKILLDEAPQKAGIDPLNILIDKNPMDNESSVSFL